jgi:hypothetical protein
MSLKTRSNMKSILVPAAIAAVTAVAMAGVPALAQGPAHRAAPAAAASPVIKTGFKNGPVTVTSSSAKTVASMSLTKGTWEIFAKAWLHGGPSAVVVSCVLAAGGDFDNASAALETGGGTAYVESIAMNVAHHFGAAGSVKLQCTTFGVPVSVNYIKITAIKAGTLTNVKLP